MEKDIRAIHVTAEAAEHISGGHGYLCPHQVGAVGCYIGQQAAEAGVGVGDLVGAKYNERGSTLYYREPKRDGAGPVQASNRLYRDGWDRMFGEDA